MLKFYVKVFRTSLFPNPVVYYVPPIEGEGGHIAFGADPIGFGSWSALYLLNQLVDFDQTCTDIIGREERSD